SLAELHPPLAQFISHYLLLVTDDIFMQRLFSVAAGLLSIIGMYRIGLELRGKILGSICALAMAFIPISVSTSIIIRNYAFFMAFLTWTLFYFLRYQKYEKRADLLYFTLLLFLASSSHFSGFLVGAACGISEGVRLVSARRWQHFILFSLTFLPLLLLGLFFYFNYLAPGTAGPMWNRLVIDTGYAPNDFAGRVQATYRGIIGYFMPLLTVVEQKSDTGLFIVLSTTLLLFILTVKGLFGMYGEKKSAGILMISIWGIALLSSLANFYPFTYGRHSYYLLPFTILPLGFELDNFIRALPFRRFVSCMAVAVIIPSVFFLAKNNIYLEYGDEFPLKRKDFMAGQAFLEHRLLPNDVIVTERNATYFYFPYALDAGKTPYDSYADVPYHHKTTVLAPFDPPFKPHYSWKPFRENLNSRLHSTITTQENKVWFVMYGWENTELWHLLNCEAVRPDIGDYFSRDGVLIFSILVKHMFRFLNNISAWESCYSDYKPLISAKKFKAPRVFNNKEVNDLP
ncbi:MAG: glycosyltransferase family 39 protein, partial [Gammaproteobacteria bacterium]